MALHYSLTRYAQREKWERNPPDEQRLKKIEEGAVGNPRHRLPLNFASTELTEALDLSHYGYTSILTHSEYGWHYGKSVTYDPTKERKVEKLRVRADIEELRLRGRDYNYAREDRNKKRKFKKMDKAEKERMTEGRSLSRDEDVRNGRRHQKKEEETWMTNGWDNTPDSILDGMPPRYGPCRISKDGKENTIKPGFPIEIRGGKPDRRHRIKGETRRVLVDRCQDENVLHMTELIGFGSDVRFGCFLMNGEMYIVLPQMLYELGCGYGHDPRRIKVLMAGLGIREIDASNHQTRVLITQKIVSSRRMNERQIGKVKLLKKSEASRLLGEYLPLEEDPNDNIKITKITAEMEAEALEVEHECQGSAKGLMYSTGYVKCVECKKIFKPDAFCCHSHRRTETVRVVHWGFSPRQWRDYINLSEDDCMDPVKRKRFEFIISEPFMTEWKFKPPSDPSGSKSFFRSLNPDCNRHPPPQFTVGAEAVGRLPEKRKTDEDDDSTVDDDDEIQIIGEQQVVRKDDFLFKAPDLFATPLSRKYTEQALKTKGVEIESLNHLNTKIPFDLEGLKSKGIDIDALFPQHNKGFDLEEGLKSKGFDLNGLLNNKSKGHDLNGLKPFKLPDHSFQNALSSLFHQPISVFAASINPSPFHLSKGISDLFPSLAIAEKEAKLLSPLKEEQNSPTLPPLPSSTTPVLPHVKEEQTLVTSSASAFQPLEPKYNQTDGRGRRKEEMQARLDAELVGVLQTLPVNVACRISELVASRDSLRDESYIDSKNDQIANGFTLQPVSPLPSPSSVPPAVPTMLPRFPNCFTTPSSLPPSSSQALSLHPPSTSVPSLLNGGRSLSMPSPIGIRPVHSSMLGQPPPSSSSISSSPSTMRQNPPKIVGQRGRPRGSGGSSYQRKHSISNGVHTPSAAEVANLQRQIEQQRQLQLQHQLRHLQQLQQQQQQLQQAYTVPQPSPMGIMTSATLSGSSSSSNLLSFGLSSSSTPVSFSSLLASASLPSTPHSIPTSDYNLRLSPAEAAAIIAKVQLDSTGSVSGSSGLSTPLAASTPNGLHASLPPTPNGMDTMQSMLHSLAPEELQRLLMQSTIMEQHQQHQLQPQSSPAAVVTQSVQQGMDQSVPLIDLDMLSTVLSNPSLLPPGLDIDQVRSWHDQLKAATTQQLQQQQ